MKIKDCQIKDVLECDDNKSIVEIAQILKKNNSRHVIITDNKKPVGIISITDISNRVVAEGKDPKKTKAKDIMTKNIFYKDIESLLSDTYVEMVKNNMISCPVTQNNKLIGVVELREVMGKLSQIKLK